jgi:hypothetical protein
MSSARHGMTEQAADAAIDQACRMLRLPTVRTRFGEIAVDAKREQMTYQGFLAELLLAECDDRARRRSIRRVKAAGFPREKRLIDFDYDANPNINPAMINTLAGCAWIRSGEPLCLIGDSGTGKSHLLIGLGTAAAEAGHPWRRLKADQNPTRISCEHRPGFSQALSESSKREYCGRQYGYRCMAFRTHRTQPRRRRGSQHHLGGLPSRGYVRSCDAADIHH